MLVLAAFVIGLAASDLVFWLALFAWGGLGAAFGSPLLLPLFWRGTSSNGIAAGFITCMLTTIIWNQTPALKTFVYELVPAFLLSTAATVIFSLLEKRSHRN